MKPIIPHPLPGASLRKAVLTLAPVWRPTINSAQITGTPIINTNRRLSNRKAPPPCSPASKGNLHMFPKPTADPTVTATTPRRVANCALLSVISNQCQIKSSPPKSKSDCKPATCRDAPRCVRRQRTAINRYRQAGTVIGNSFWRTHHGASLQPLRHFCRENGDEAAKI